MSDIVLSKDIYETVRIKDHTGKVLSEFSFNPSDANIVERYEEFVQSMEELVKDIESFESLSDSEKDYDKAKDKKKFIDEAIHKKMNDLLNADVSESIFSVMGALSPLPSGDYYWTFIFEQIGKKIQNATGARLQKIDMKIKKHTAKYHK